MKHIHFPIKGRSLQTSSSKTVLLTTAANTTNTIKNDHKFNSTERSHNVPLSITNFNDSLNHDSRYPSPVSDCSSSHNIERLKNDLQCIVADGTVCDVTMNKLLIVLHDHFPWLPDNVAAMRNKSVGKSEFQQIMESLDDIKNRQVIIKKELLNLKVTKFSVRYTINTERESFRLPFYELDAFQEFDNQVKQDKETYRRLKSIFIKHSELNIKKFIKNNIEVLFTLQLAKKFSYTGRQGNIKCKNLHSIMLLKECVIEIFPDSTSKTFDTLATKYFYFIKDKLKKVEKRTKAKCLT